MKKWTVMLIPHDRGNTRTLTLMNAHLWVVVGVLALLTFTSSYYFARHQSLQAQERRWRESHRALEMELARKVEATPPAAVSDKEIRDVEAKLRAEYETSLAAITAELSALYDMETKARDITGFAPRELKPEPPAKVQGTGKGGSPGGQGGGAFSVVNEAMRPPHIIYGMSRPSADLLLEEIRVRYNSLAQLVRSGEAERDRLARIPSAWPLTKGAGRITSGFGFRVDPLNRRIRHHDGTDIAAPAGTPVRAPARGVVSFAGWDGYLGNLIKIDHGNGLETWYAHLSRIDVREGQAVEREDRIGAVGSTGRSTGSHLHFEVHKNGKTVDPEKYLTD